MKAEDGIYDGGLGLMDVGGGGIVIAVAIAVV